MGGHFSLVRGVGLQHQLSHLRAQIENPAHRLGNKCRLIGCSSVQQHCHRRQEHLFYDATAKRFHKLLLIRAQIAQASAHVMNFTAAHGLKTLS